MNNGDASDLGDFSPRSSACSLREACKKVGRDEGGDRCSDCPLRARCEDE